jgi:hypothetical protein
MLGIAGTLGCPLLQGGKEASMQSHGQILSEMTQKLRIFTCTLLDVRVTVNIGSQS